MTKKNVVESFDAKIDKLEEYIKSVKKMVEKLNARFESEINLFRVNWIECSRVSR